MFTKGHPVYGGYKKGHSPSRVGPPWNKGIKLTEEQKENLYIVAGWNRGVKMSQETKDKISKANKGKKRSEEFKKEVSIRFKDKPKSIETREKMSLSLKNRKITNESKLKMSLAKKGKPNYHLRGEKSLWWKGGVTKTNKQKRNAIYNSLEYRNWRRAVYERDHFTCQICGAKNVRLNADHIKPFALYPKLRYELSNGRTLCINCHKKTDTFAGRTKSRGLI